MTKKRYVKNDWDFRFEQRVKYQDKQRNIILQGILSDDKANYQDNTENPEVEVVTTTSLPRARVLYIYYSVYRGGGPPSTLCANIIYITVIIVMSKRGYSIHYSDYSHALQGV